MKGVVLVVDDDFEIREAVAEVLRHEGYAVETAVNGVDALERVRRGLVPRLVLLDLMMPVMDGSTLCQTWKADPELAPIPVLIVSADGATARKARACGANGFLRKPVQLDDLIQAVERYAA